MGKTIFVANIPFETSEEQLAHVFAEAGPVQGVEIKFDNEGKPRGYAFVQFYDDAAAESAVRNLKGVQVKDRSLRIEMSSDTPNHRQGGGAGGGRQGGGGRGGGMGGMGGGRGRSPPPPFRQPPPPGAGYGGPPPPIVPPYGQGPGVGGGYNAPPPVVPPPRVDLGMVPPGQDLPRGESAMDQISKTLASIGPGQMQDVMAGMKTLIATSPDQARQLLAQTPQLAYALFQAMLLMNIVDPQVLQHVKPIPAPGPGPGPAPSPYPPSNYAPTPQQGYQPPPQSYQPPPQAYQPPPPPQSADPRLNTYRPPPPPQAGGGYAPPPQQPGLSPAVQAQLATLPEDQRTTLMSVLQMTPDQINTLDPTQRQSVMQLRQQFLGV